MRRFLGIFCTLLVATVVAFSGVSDVYALGHGDSDPESNLHMSGTVLGCDTCHNFDTGYYDSPSLGNLRWIKDSIEWPPDSGDFWDIVYRNFDSTGTNDPPGPEGPGEGTLSDGDPNLLNGPCEVCHVNTNYHTNPTDDGTTDHYDGNNCTTVCHPHFLTDITDYFEVRFVGGQSHETHLASYDDPKGPYIADCNDCHQEGNFSFFADGEKLEDTTVCDTCHSQDGDYDGVGEYDPNDTSEDDTWELAHPNSVAFGAKYNWENGIYNEEKGDSLKEGKRKWCTGCHDDIPSIIEAVSAPKVAGDDEIFGYWVSGHGRSSTGYPNGLTCGGTDPEYLDSGCHNLQGKHIDGDAKTYQVDEGPMPPTVVNPYRSSYRLNARLDVPRLTHELSNPGEYKLCTQCHTTVFGSTSNFRFEKSPSDALLHNIHADYVYPSLTWDSDNDGRFVGPENPGDSAMTCPTCHNVHGSRIRLAGSNYAPNPVMIRDGWLTGTFGLDFRWFDKDFGSTGSGSPTAVLLESKSGELWAVAYPPDDPYYDPTCAWQPCHASLPFYNRDALGSATLSITEVWLTDLSNDPKSVFKPDDDIRVHVSFKITGKDTYYVKSLAGINKLSFIKAPGVGKTKLGPIQRDTLPAGTYFDHWTWDKTIKSNAEAGIGKVKVQMKIFDAAGEILITTADKQTAFTCQL